MHLAKPHKILAAGGALLNGMAEDLLQDLVTDHYDNQNLARVDIVVVPGMTADKKDIVTIFDYEDLRQEKFNVTVPLRSESGDL